MKIPGGPLAARVAAIKEVDFIQPSKIPGITLPFEDACLDFHERQIWTVANQIIAEMEIKEAEAIFLEGDDQVVAYDEIFHLNEQYKSLMALLEFYYQDRLNCWTLHLEVDENFLLVISQDEQELTDTLKGLLGEQKFALRLDELVKDYLVEQKSETKTTEPVQKEKISQLLELSGKNFTAIGRGSNRDN